MVLFCLSDSIHYMFTLFLNSTLPSVLSFLRVKLCFDVMKVCVTCPHIPQKGIGASVTNSLGRTLCGWVRPIKNQSVGTNAALFSFSWQFHKLHDDVIKWKHFRRYWPFVRWIHRSPVNSHHKGQWRGALMFSLICARINDWVNNHQAGDLRRHRAHYDVTVMLTGNCGPGGRYRILRHSFKLLRRW